MASIIEQHADLEGILLVRKEVFSDGRGFFSEIFKESEICKLIGMRFGQANFSLTKKIGTIRGLHFQKHPNEQGKLITVTSGRIFDVAVDIRKGSSTFGKWTSFIIDSSQELAVFLPGGFAHGFQVLEEDTQVLYFCTSEYSPSSEGSIRWDDPEIGIEWPIGDPDTSEKDSIAPFLNDWSNDS